MFAVTFLAVAKVLVATFVGALMKSSVPSSTSTLRDFNFINTNIMLPCLTVANTAKSVDLQVLIRCSALLFFGLIFILVGIGCAVVTSPFLFKVPRAATGIPVDMAKEARLELRYDPLKPEEEEESQAPSATAAAGAHSKSKKKKRAKRKGKPYVALILSDRLKERGVTGQDVVPSLEVPGIETETFPGYAWGNWLGCSIQNTIALPLPILQTLSQTIPWVDYTAGSAYIFVFSIMCTIWTWSGGPIIVEFSQKESVKRHLIREIIHRHLQMPQHTDATTQTGRHMASPSSVTGRTPRGSPVGPHSPLSPTAAAATPTVTTRTTVPSHADEASATVPGDVTQPVEELVQPPTRATRPAVEPVGALDTDPSFFAPAGTGAAAAVGRSDCGLQTSAVSPLHPRLPLGRRSFPEVADLHGVTAGFAHSASDPNRPRTLDGLALEVEPSAEQIPYDWETEGLIRVFYECDVKASKQDGASVWQRVSKAVRSLCGRLIRNVNFVSIFVGMFIGIVPFVRGLFFNGPLEIFMDAASLLGGGNVPAALLLLGASLVGTAEVDVKGTQAQKMVRDSEQNTQFPVYQRALDLLDTEGAYEQWFNEDTDMDPTEAYDVHALVSAAQHSQEQETSPPAGQDDAVGSRSSARVPEELADMASTQHDERPAGTVDGEVMRRAPAYDGEEDSDKPMAANEGGCLSSVGSFLSMDGISPRFLWGVIFNRLFLCTLVGFIMTVVCVRLFPFLFGGRGNEDRTMIVVLFLQVAAPTAINTSLLYNNREYMVFPWARMLLFMYLLSTITVVGWVTISLSIVEAL